MMIKIILTWCLFNTVQAISQHPILIVISYDAFRYDLFDTKLVPNMERLRKVGTYSDYMANIFPTKTFPNHHAIATGFYTESHGIIGNRYYDSRSGIVHKNSRELFHYDDDIVPIWRWNEDQGDGRYSASMMWPGAEFTYQGKNITNAYVLDKNLDFSKKVDIMMSWLTDPVKPVNLVMFWEGVLDYAAHAFGPNAEEFKNALRQLDNLTKIIEVQLEKHNLTERTNVIHLSDHGIMAVPMSNFINFTQYIRPGTYVMTGSSSMMEIYPKEGYEKEVYDPLKVGSNRNGHFKVYKRDEFPKEWHYANSRTAPILVLADVGYALENLIPKAQEFAKTFNFTLTNSTEFGVHGYDPTEKSMRPFFMARGPKIRRHHKVAPFNNTDLYNLFTEILEIPHRSNNGSMKNILDVLRIDDINDDVNDDIN